MGIIVVFWPSTGSGNIYSKYDFFLDIIYCLNNTAFVIFCQVTKLLLSLLLYKICTISNTAALQ